MNKNEIIHITKEHTGKMQGMQSISTSVLCNKYCASRRNKKDLVCSKCYAAAMSKRYTSMNAVFERNTKVLTESIIDCELLPTITSDIFRLESFGDLNNSTQVINYFNICRKNKNTTFALWTKNPFLIHSAIAQGYKKPKNLIVIYSSPKINSNFPNLKYYDGYSFIDKQFTVYTKDYAAKNNININCGARNCATCRRCYNKRTSKQINEILK